MKVSTGFTIEFEDCMAIRTACRATGISYSDYLRFCVAQMGVPDYDMLAFMGPANNPFRRKFGAYVDFKRQTLKNEEEYNKSVKDSRESAPPIPHKAY